MALRRLLLTSLALFVLASCGRSNLGFGDDGSARRPGQSDAGIRPDVTEDIVDPDVDPDADPDGTPGDEICDNGVDDDLDGRIDCDDADCIDDPACAVDDCPAVNLGDAVSDFAPVAEFETDDDTTTTACLGEGLPDMTFAWRAPFTGRFEVAVDGPIFGLEIRRGTCAGEPIYCGEPFAEPFEAERGEAFVIVVEGFEPGALSALFIFGEPVETFEICDNGIDDDGNGLVDCEDFACDCPPDFEFNCFNGRDDDQDGLFDCEDPDCFDQCETPFEFDCANGFDDDGDGAVDCDDDDCAGSPECALECPAVDIGSDTGRPVIQSPAFSAPNQFTSPCSPFFDTGEVGVAWRAPSAGRWTFSTEGSEGFHPLYVRRGGCFGEDIGCTEDEVLTLNLGAGQAVVIFVEGFDGAGTLVNLSVFRADVPSEAGQCGDGRDNDGDGRIDCTDPDCALDPLCEGPAFELCDNGIDDDFDRLVDCDDPDCQFSPSCRGIERNCANGRDDDGDGAIDCDDSDCFDRPVCGGEAEICFDGIDNDGDRQIDCDDPDCFDSPFCFGFEICDNGFDDDRDGLRDCADPDCARDPACTPDVEICFNRRDDDGDRLIDCDDPDCFGAPECPTSTCPDAELPPELLVPIATGSTVGAGNDDGGSCGGGGAPERAFAWTAPFSGTFRIDTVGSSFDTVLYVRAGGCDGFEIACDDDTGGSQSRVDIDVDAGEQIIIFVDGFGNSSGPFALSIREVGVDSEFGLCDDGIDNDLDGRTDCGDFDCRRDPACRSPENCTNGVDDDGDGAVDCDDPDCFGTPFCFEPEDCGNGADDDFDGLIDCDDPDCLGFPECRGDEICFNGIDDDGDGAIDCDDEDCEGFPLCEVGPEICDNGIDDDFNGLVDCEDRACRFDEACIDAEICFNGFDDDFDGRVDCEDPDCFGSPFCETEIELCANGVDDDGDGAVDCDDPDCFGSDACADVCPDANLGSALGTGVALGSTAGGTATGGGSCGGDGAPDVTFAWQAPASGAYVFDTDGSDYDTILHIRNGSCEGAELACDDDGIRVGGASRIELTLRRNQRVVLFVDGWNTSSGDFQLNINAVGVDTEAGFCTDFADNDGDGFTDCDDPDCFGDPSCIGFFEVCDNGFDDDFDGAVDCEDPDCFDDPFCGGEPEVCFDGVDNDGDGRIDCDDADCAGSPFCAFVEICDNGFDDDRDGRVDCADRDCFDDPACVGPEPEICTDGIDNDLDGRTDCADTDCFLDPACFFSEDCSNGVDDDGDGFVDCADPSCFFDPACPEGEDCNNGVDDDGDGQIDCNDPECVFDPICAASEDCTNGIDDDGDGFIDCADLTCVLDPTCQTPENCFNGVDDDDDGFVDCDDSECADVPICEEPACPNDDLGFATGDAIATGSTRGAGNDTRASCGGAGSEDVGFVWTAPRPGRYAIDTVGSNYDTLLAVLSGTSCEGEELLCDDDTPPLGTRSRIFVDAVRGESFTILIEGFGSSAGDFVLNINRVFTTEAGRCANGEDDDLDNAIDCDDPDCFTDPACGAPENCGNGVDDDFDGAVDCEDADCDGSPLCVSDEICTNGVDDDGDDLADCDDPDCFDDAACVDACPAFDLGSALGAGVAAGSTVGSGNDVDGSCFGGAGEDIGFAWRAPANGRYRFDTFGSSFDTQLHVRLGDCEGDEIACNDDTGGTQSAVTVPLTAGTEVVVFVDGFGAGSSGEFVLNITRVLGSETGFCTDGVDNDADGETDCDDSDCDTDDACITPEICFNGIDDDRDGAVDCDDEDCFGFPTCGEPEICDNGIDDDLDGSTDCDDVDCEGDPACSACPEESIGSSTGDFVFFGPTFGRGDNADGSCSTGGEEVSVSWIAPAAGRYRATTEGSPFPTTLYARRGCDGPELACDADFEFEGAEILFSVRGGTEVVFFLEGVEGDGAEAALSIFQIPTNEAGLCFDGIDNDADGAADCDDGDCADDPLCVLPEVCFNGFDDDGDGLIDCEDDDCFGDPACFSEDENCGNGFDDDGDGATDCADTECLLSPECIGAEDCNNGVDDDGNGRTDCQDPSCSIDPACFTAEICFNGIDDDDDGLTDCDDPSCAFRPACAGANEEDCSNGIDDDGDGQVDCDDFGCLISIECLPFP